MISYEEIRKIANQLVTANSLDKEFPIHIEKIVEGLGFKCHFYIPDDDIKDIDSAVSHIKKKIYVNQNNTSEQQLFTIACKVGHIILHGNNKDYVDHLNLPNIILEKEAECFARYLLMPESAFRKYSVEFNRDIHRLATFFGVPAPVVQEHAEALGFD